MAQIKFFLKFLSIFLILKQFIQSVKKSVNDTTYKYWCHKIYFALIFIKNSFLQCKSNTVKILAVYWAMILDERVGLLIFLRPTYWTHMIGNDSINTFKLSVNIWSYLGNVVRSVRWIRSEKDWETVSKLHFPLKVSKGWNALKFWDAYFCVLGIIKISIE